jgi:hypothetical protein
MRARGRRAIVRDPKNVKAKHDERQATQELVDGVQEFGLITASSAFIQESGDHLPYNEEY